MRNSYKIKAAIFLALSSMLLSACHVDFQGSYDVNDAIDKFGNVAGSIADKFTNTSAPDSIAGDITFINAADITVSDYGSNIYSLLPNGVFDKIFVDSDATIANISTLAILSKQENPDLLVDKTKMASTYDDFALDARNFICTDLESVLIDNKYLSSSLINTINDKYMGTVSNILASHDKETYGEAWFVLSAKDDNGANKRLYWRIGQGIDGRTTAYFLCYPNCLITGELAYYLIALYSNDFATIDCQAIMNEYFGLVGKPEHVAIYNKTENKFSFTIV